MIAGLSRAELQALILSVGTHSARRRLSPIEVASLLRQAIQAGTSERLLSDALKISEIQVSRFVGLFDLVPEVRNLAGWGRASAGAIPFSVLLEIRQLHPEQQSILAHSILTHKLTRNEVRQISQIVRRSGRCVDYCIEEVVGRRAQVQSQFMLMGAIRECGMREYLQGQSEEIRSGLLRDIFQSMGVQDGVIRGRLGAETFAISANQEIADLLNMEPDDVEIYVNEWLWNNAEHLRQDM